MRILYAELLLVSMLIAQQPDTSFVKDSRLILVADTTYGVDSLFTLILKDLSLGVYLAKRYAKANIVLRRQGNWYAGQVGERIIDSRFKVLLSRPGEIVIYAEGDYQVWPLLVYGKVLVRYRYFQVGDSLLFNRIDFYFYTRNIIANGFLFLNPNLLPGEAAKILDYLRVIGREIIFNPTTRRIIINPP